MVPVFEPEPYLAAGPLQVFPFDLDLLGMEFYSWRTVSRFIFGTQKSRPEPRRSFPNVRFIFGTQKSTRPPGPRSFQVCVASIFVRSERISGPKSPLTCFLTERGHAVDGQNPAYET